MLILRRYSEKNNNTEIYAFGFVNRICINSNSTYFRHSVEVEKWFICEANSPITISNDGATATIKKIGRIDLKSK